MIEATDLEEGNLEYKPCKSFKRPKGGSPITCLTLLYANNLYRGHVCASLENKLDVFKDVWERDLGAHIMRITQATEMRF